VPTREGGNRIAPGCRPLLTRHVLAAAPPLP
jgi:hypothetical protein